jgi:uncharacterized protein (TIGR02118 family)
MYKVTVVYRALKPGQRFDERHYHEVQLAKALSFLGRYRCQKIELTKAVTDVPERVATGWPETIYRTMELWFDTLEDLRACIFSPEMRQLDEGFRDRAFYDRDVESFIGEVERYEFANGTLVAAHGPWAAYFADQTGR